MIADVVGFTAGFLTSVNMIPQIVKSIKTKEVEDISLWMFLIYDVGLLLWTIYGFMISSLPIIFMDGFAFLSSMFMTYVKVRYHQK